MKADIYHETLDEVHSACRGTMDGSWNMSFMSELKARGLTLSATMPEANHELYPGDGLPYQAPLSFGDRHGWAYRSFIVWAPCDDTGLHDYQHAAVESSKANPSVAPFIGMGSGKSVVSQKTITDALSNHWDDCAVHAGTTCTCDGEGKQ